jgi:hypothetical protein
MLHFVNMSEICSTCRDMLHLLTCYNTCRDPIYIVVIILCSRDNHDGFFSKEPGQEGVFDRKSL